MRRRLVIAGCGPVGLLAALVLSDLFEQVDVLERRLSGQAQSDAVSRSLQLVLSARGWAALERGRVADVIRSRAQPIRGRVHLGTGAFSPYSPHGDAIYAVARDQLQTLLEEAVSAHRNVRLRYGHEVVTADSRGRTVSVQTPDGPRRFDFDLLVGADGVRSNVAESLHPRGGLRLEVARQVYREVHLSAWPFRPDAFHFIGDGEILVGGFPARGGGGGLFVMHPQSADEALFDPSSGRSVLDRLPRLREAFGAALLADWAAVEVGVMGSKTCARWTADGAVALAGDAAHAVLPFMGQGLNVGLEDVIALDACLRDGGGDPLTRYAALRRPEADAIRAISARHARLLFGARTEAEQARDQRVQDELARQGWPDSYCAAAFTRTPFSEIRRRELIAERALESARIA